MDMLEVNQTNRPKNYYKQEICITKIILCMIEIKIVVEASYYCVTFTLRPKDNYKQNLNSLKL